MRSRRIISFLPALCQNFFKLHLSRSSSSSPQWKQFEEKDVKNHVANIFSCNQKHADDLVDSFKGSFAKDRCGRIEVLRALRKKGLSIQQVSSCKKAVTLPLDAVRERLRFSSKVLLDESPTSILSVLRLADKDLTRMNQILVGGNHKINDFSDLTKCSRLDALHAFVKFPFLLRSKISTLRSKFDLLIASGLSAEEVKKDLWVLTYTLKRLEDRIDHIKSLEISPIKPWMLRCLPHILERTVSNRFENQAALSPYPNTAAYLAHRLGVKEEEIERFAQKHPPVMRVQVAKMKEMIDFLLSEGYSQAKIVSTPRILCHSLLTIQGRLSELKNRNYFPQTLSVLCKSKRKYAEFVKKVDQCRSHA